MTASDPSRNWNETAERVLRGEELPRDAALAALAGAEDDLLPLLHAAFRVRSRHHGRMVRVNVIQNAKSGSCSEDCTFCSQSARAEGEIPRYSMRSVGELVEGAARAVDLGATTYCIVTSLRRPSERDLETICDAAGRIKERWPIRVCVSLGLLDEARAARLRAAGVDRYNHNLETARNHFPNVCTTHRYEDRVATVRAARAAGMEACCGGIIGLGETMEDRVDLAFALRELRVESIPVNFFDPRPGTPLADRPRPSPTDCLRSLALIRLSNPQATDVRMAGGRESCLGTVQPLALFAANSLFTEGYLTTPGQGLEQDLRMIREAGFEPEVLAE
jgi:biotin synthase